MAQTLTACCLGTRLKTRYHGMLALQSSTGTKAGTENYCLPQNRRGIARDAWRVCSLYIRKSEALPLRQRKNLCFGWFHSLSSVPSHFSRAPFADICFQME